jgi:hypothetical protein
VVVLVMVVDPFPYSSPIEPPMLADLAVIRANCST